MNFLKRLLGIVDTGKTARLSPHAGESGHTQRAATTPVPERDRRAPDVDVVTRYFELSTEIEGAKRERDYRRAIRAARATYEILPAVVQQMKRDYGRFDI